MQAKRKEDEMSPKPNKVPVEMQPVAMKAI